MEQIGISNFYISSDGPMTFPGNDDSFAVGAMYCFERNISELFPYINAVAQDSELHESPKMVRFVFDGVYCVAYPERLMASALADKAHADAFRVKIFDFLNDIVRNKEKITPKFKVHKKISAISILKILPKTNCGECGFTSCVAFAAMASKQRVQPSKCPYVGLPIDEQATYPVRDENGKVISTITLPVDTTGSGPAEIERPDHSKKEPPASGRPETSEKNPGREPKPPLPFNLSKRELEVLSLMGSGLTNPEISKQLYISPHTVKSHVINIFNKLGVNHRTQAVVWAARHQII